jgi:hypothetical protein
MTSFSPGDGPSTRSRRRCQRAVRQARQRCVCDVPIPGATGPHGGALGPRGHRVYPKSPDVISRRPHLRATRAISRPKSPDAALPGARLVISSTRQGRSAATTSFVDQIGLGRATFGRFRRRPARDASKRQPKTAVLGALLHHEGMEIAVAVAGGWGAGRGAFISPGISTGFATRGPHGLSGSLERLPASPGLAPLGADRPVRVFTLNRRPGLTRRRWEPSARAERDFIGAWPWVPQKCSVRPPWLAVMTDHMGL